MTWVVMLVALLAGSIAAAVVWQVSESDAQERRLVTSDEVLSTVKRAVGDVFLTTSGAAALVEADGTVSRESFERFAANAGDTETPTAFAWLTKDDTGAWTVRFSDPGALGDRADTPPTGTSFPTGSNLADAADGALMTGQTAMGLADLPDTVGGGSEQGTGSALFVLKPVYRPTTSDTGGGGGTPIGVLVVLRPAPDLATAISADLDPGVLYAVSDDRSVLASSTPPPGDGVIRTTYLSGQPFRVRIQDDRPVNHDLSWFLLWISGIVFAAAGTVGLRSARYDEDRRRANMLITGTAELAQDLAGTATVDDVSRTISERLPALLGADLVAFGVVDHGLGRLRFHEVDRSVPDPRLRLGDLELADAPAVTGAGSDAGRIVLLRTPEEWHDALPAGVVADLLAGGATTAAIVPLEAGGHDVVAAVVVLWTSAPDLDQRMMATLDTVKELSEQTLGRAELTDRVSTHASQMAVLAERLAGTDTVAEAVRSVTLLAAAPVGATSVQVHVAASDDAPTPATGDDVPDRGRELTLPLRADGVSIGSVGFTWGRPVRFDEDLVNDLTTVSEMTAQSIRRAHLVEQLRASLVRNQALAEFAQHVANVRSARDLCRAVVEHAAAGVGAAVADIGLASGPGSDRWLRPEPRPSPELVASGSPSRLVLPARECLRLGEPVVVSGRSGLDDSYPSGVRQVLRDRGIAQSAHLPLIGSDGVVLGVLAVAWTSVLEVSDTIGAKLQTLGGLCSQTVQRVRLAEAEHRLVVSLQERVVRPAPPTDHLVIAERYLPASEQVGMGGDWFEGIPVDEDRFAVVVGDIAGHGIAAVADMVELRAIIGSLLRSATPLGEVYPRVAALLQQAGSDLTATSCTAVFDTAAGTVEYVSAGHLPPVLGRPDGTVELLTEGRQPLLGVPSGPVAAGVTSFEPGAVLAIYTDGIVERRGEPIDVSLSRIRRALRELLAEPGPAATARRQGDSDVDVEAVADGLLRRCLDDRATDDDVALVVISHVRP